MVAKLDRGRADENWPNRNFTVFFLLILIGVGIFVSLLSWSVGGGIYSIVHAIHAVQQRDRVVDIDDAGLRYLFVIACSVPVTALSYFLNVDLRKSVASLVFLFFIIGGGFVFDRVYDEPVMQAYMRGHGYSRCGAGDWAHGNGKSRVWLDDYVLGGVECRQRMATTVERTPFK